MVTNKYRDMPSRHRLPHPRAQQKSLFSIVVEHRLLLSSLLASIFSVVCYFFTNIFLSEFNVDFFIFSGFSDVYRVALANGVVLQIFALSVIPIVAVQVGWITIKNGVEIHDLSSLIDQANWKGFGIFVCVLAGISLALFFTLFIFLKVPEQSANLIKKGVVSRYLLKVKDAEIKCVSLVAGTSNYYFVWSHEQSTSLVIPKDDVTRFELQVPEAPKPLVPRSKWDSDDEYAARQKEHEKKKIAWNQLLAKKCNQSVDWDRLSTAAI